MDVWLKSCSNLTYNWFLRPGGTPKNLVDSKLLAIDTVSQNRLNSIKNHEIRCKLKIGSRVVTLGGYPLGQSFGLGSPKIVI